MSRSAHAQSTYELRKLPVCSRCNTEFILVCARYEGIREPVVEWECPKCHKAVARRLLKEEQPSDEDTRLSEFCKKEHKEHSRPK